MISFVVPVFNQSELLKIWLEESIKCEGEDIEFVISDDSKDEQARMVVDELNDGRLKYVKNINGRGQDRNIINGINQSNGEYIYLFRTKDFPIPCTMSELCTATKKGYSFITGGAIDESGKQIIRYKNNEIIPKGEEALYRHYMLYDHPSGFIFKKSLLDLKKLNCFMKDYIQSPYFVWLSDMIGLSMSMKGDYYLIKNNTWVYANTNKAKTKSANNGSKFIYDLTYNIMAFGVELAWSCMEVEDIRMRSYSAARLFGKFLKLSTWRQLEFYRDEGYRFHYNLDENTVFDFDLLRKQFLNGILVFEKKYGLEHDEYYNELKNNEISSNINRCKSLN